MANPPPDFVVKTTKAMPYISAPYRSQAGVFNSIRSALINIPIADTDGREIELAPWPNRVGKDATGRKTLEFPDNGSPESARLKLAGPVTPDVVIIATGYRREFMFLSDEYPKLQDCKVRGIYADIDDGLAYIGFVRPSIGKLTSLPLPLSCTDPPRRHPPPRRAPSPTLGLPPRGAPPLQKDLRRRGNTNTLRAPPDQAKPRRRSPLRARLRPPPPRRLRLLRTKAGRGPRRAGVPARARHGIGSQGESCAAQARVEGLFHVGDGAQLQHQVPAGWALGGAGACGRDYEDGVV